jgi:hypothetical protein
MAVIPIPALKIGYLKTKSVIRDWRAESAWPRRVAPWP